MHALLDPILRYSDEARRIYSSPAGARLVAGDILRLPDLADTFEAIARRGAAALYRGERARAMVATVRDGGGELTLDDLAAYRVVWRRPVRVAFRRPRGALEPAAVVGRRPDRLRARAARAAAGGARPAARRRVAALAEVMREQGRARGGGFVRDLHRGGLAGRLLVAGVAPGGQRRIERAPGRRARARRRPAGRRTSR